VWGTFINRRVLRRERGNSIGAPLDTGIRELRLQEVESVIRAMRTWLREQETSWYREGMHALVSRCRKAVDVDGGYVEK
jgi:23S rRNA maturation mini-RNase III